MPKDIVKPVDKTDKAIQVRNAYGRVFATHEGQIVLQDLVRRIRGRAACKGEVGEVRTSMMIFAAQHDILFYIETQIEAAKSGGKDVQKPARKD